jgi:hypothetical protein
MPCPCCLSPLSLKELQGPQPKSKYSTEHLRVRPTKMEFVFTVAGVEVQIWVPAWALAILSWVRDLP